MSNPTAATNTIRRGVSPRSGATTRPPTTSPRQGIRTQSATPSSPSRPSVRATRAGTTTPTNSSPRTPTSGRTLTLAERQQLLRQQLQRPRDAQMPPPRRLSVEETIQRLREKGRQRSGSNPDLSAAKHRPPPTSSLKMYLVPCVTGLDRFPPHAVNMYRQIFNQIGTDNDGMISLAELSATLSTLSRDRLNRLVQRGGVDNSTPIDFEQFVELMSNPGPDLGESPDVAHVPPELIREYKKVYEEILRKRGARAKLGGIPIEDVAAGLGLSVERTKQIFNPDDLHNDGILSFDEFLEIVTDDRSAFAEGGAAEVAGGPPGPPLELPSSLPPPPPPSNLDFGDFDLANNRMSTSSDDSGAATDRTATTLRRPSILSRQRPFSFADVGDLLDRSSEWAQNVQEAMVHKRRILAEARERSSLTREMANQLEDYALMMTIPPHLISEYKEIFNDIDIDNNGSVSAEELARAFDIAVEKAKQLMVENTGRHSNTLTFPEFIDLVNNDDTYEATLREPEAKPNPSLSSAMLAKRCELSSLDVEPTPRTKGEINARVDQIKRMSVHLSESLIQLDVYHRGKFI